MTPRIALCSLVLAFAGTLLPTAGQAQDTVKVGTLRCNVSAGLGLVVTSSRDMNCVFRPSNGPREAYRGTIRRFGLDIGATSKGVLVWGVVAATRRPVKGALAGDYVGAAAEATAGVGLGVNALVGGSDRAYSLQPISVEGQLGLNLAAGVAQMTLVNVRRQGA
ncbi:MAG: DUF992 domain-containing protein [Beijerinckiaceae bacterium]